MPQTEMTKAGLNYNYNKKKIKNPIKGFVDRRKKEAKKK